jgi:phosphoribosylamine--glycine ligase
MKILVVGSGGREHALSWAIAGSPVCDTLFCAPGNAGIAAIAKIVPIGDTDVDALVAFAQSEKIGLVVVGPEAALVMELVDRLESAGILAFGPTAAAAEIEGSKGFMKDLCAKHGIPTAPYARFDEPDAAKDYVRTHGPHLVIKADGLAAGKGVILCHSNNEAFAAIDRIMTERSFGDAGAEVVIEAFMDGEEASFFALSDGHTVVALASAQDHKAAYDGDKGPNTGGMGAYSPAPVITKAIEKKIMERIVVPTIAAMKAEGRPYKGVLYAGLMINTKGEPRVVEFNARFGDPECQVLMMRLKSDIVTALLAAAKGKLDGLTLEWRRETALLVALASNGYPGDYRKGTEIKNVAEAQAMTGVQVFHAGTAHDGDKLVATGGRVLGVTALGKTVEQAQKRAYEAVDAIDWPEGFCRRDIGWRAIARKK